MRAAAEGRRQCFITQRVQMWLQDVVLHLSLEVWIKSCQADFKSRSQSRKWHSFHLQCLLVDFTCSLIFIPAKPLFVPWQPRALCAQTPDECGGDGELLRTRVTQPAELQRWPITHPSRVGSGGLLFTHPIENSSHGCSPLAICHRAVGCIFFFSFVAVARLQRLCFPHYAVRERLSLLCSAFAILLKFSFSPVMKLFP